MLSNRDKKLVYHLTAIKNLASIKQHGLLSRRALRSHGTAFKDVADSKILDGRTHLDLEAMVPFHFIHRSPFDYNVVHSNPGVSFALLGVRRTLARSQRWKVIARHPLSDNGSLRVQDWDEGIETIDWSQMDRKIRDYNDHECKMVCMAEALSPAPVAFSSISNIYIASTQDRTSVLEVVGSSHGVLVDVNAGMFPRGGK